jgi:hypothetical protein
MGSPGRTDSSAIRLCKSFTGKGVEPLVSKQSAKSRNVPLVPGVFMTGSYFDCQHALADDGFGSAPC